LPRKIKDISGRIVKGWTVRPEHERRGDTYWLLQCQRGNKKWASGTHLKTGEVGSCQQCKTKANPTPAVKPSKPIKAVKIKEPWLGKFNFPEDRCKALVIDWQKTRCDHTFEDILKLVAPLNNILLNRKQIHKYCDMDECHQELAIKLFKILPKFNPDRGSKLFSYLQCCLSRRILNFAINSAKEPEFISIDYHEDSEGGHHCPGMFALNKKAIENWRNGESSASSAMAEDDEWEFPAEEKQAIAWLIETLSPDTASDASAHIIAELSRFGLDPDRSKSIFWKTLVNIRKRKRYKTSRMAKRIQRMLATD
jgi:hypothetical protein